MNISETVLLCADLRFSCDAIEKDLLVSFRTDPEYFLSLLRSAMFPLSRVAVFHDSISVVDSVSQV